MEENDVDDLALLQELLDVEDELADGSALNLIQPPAPQQKANECPGKSSFEEFLEGLDSLPIKSDPASNISSSGNKICNANKKNAVNSAIHSGDTDSSDDEDNRHLEHRFSEYGVSVKKALDIEAEIKQSSEAFKGVSQQSSWKSPASTSLSTNNNTLCLASKKQDVLSNVYTDPHIGIRIINPLVSSASIGERLTGRSVISMAHIKQFVSEGKPSDDWVVFGVIVSKLPPKTSSKGTTYSVIKLSDLKGPGNLKIISVFLFSRAYKAHGKDSVGTVIGILNPGIMDNSRNHNDEACLSVDNPDKIMIIGTSKDFGTCKSKKKNGENCTSIVNTACCEYCVYHVKQEYMKCSRRSDIQSSFNGTGLTNLRNKVLGKSEVFYAGQSFTAVPAKKNKKLHEKDQRRLSALSGTIALTSSSSAPVSKKSTIAPSLDLGYRQAQKDADRLRKLVIADTSDRSPCTISNNLQTTADEVKISDAKCAALSLISKKKETLSQSPKLCNETDGSSVVPSFSLTSRGAQVKMSLQKIDAKCNMTPSSLGLGSNSLLKGMRVEEPSLKMKPENLKDENTSVNASSVGNVVKCKTKVQHKAKNFTPLDSKQLLKISSNGLNMESRLLKQAAMKIAEQEATSKLGPNCTPSMLGLGRSTVNRATPVLGRGHDAKSTIDLDIAVRKMISPSTPLNKRVTQSARLKAINLIQRCGGLQKEDPNIREFESRKKKSPNERKGVKRPLASSDNFICEASQSSMASVKEAEHKAKMAKFKELMETTSKHTDLIEAAENNAKDEYFNKLEKKEQMEEKMLNTFKVACKAVRCLVCKYTAFSSSDFCKAERHPLKVMDATKRFWKCGTCGNRTVSLELIPLKSCTNCNSSRWEKAAMIREKVGISQEKLCIRGLEEKFIGSAATGGNINLLVPDES